MNTLVADRYRLDSELGSGGMAEVCLAWDIVMDRACAVKLLLPVQGPGADARRQRMQAEARSMASLDHPHVVQVFDHGEHEGRDFIAMEYVAGGSLEDRLRQDGPLTPAHAARLVLQVLDALGAAHAQGMVHRDVKPANVLLRSSDDVALCDFGIARSAQAGGTQTGVALGSVGYMAPEQRIDARSVGPAADLYGAACTLFNLVTGDTPVDLCLAPDHSPRWADVPPPLVPVLRRATQADPTARYHDAVEMREALASVQGALEGLAPLRRRQTVAAAYPTSDAPGHNPLTIEAGSRKRSVRAEDWQPRRGRPPGRMALWVGTALVASLTLGGLAFRPVLHDMQHRLGGAPAEVEPDPLLAAPALEGRWLGNIEGNRRVALTLTGGPRTLAGRLVLGLGEHQRISEVQGRWDTLRNQVVLRELDSGLTFRASPGEVPGLLVGTVHLPDQEPLAVAVVWVEGPAPPE